MGIIFISLIIGIFVFIFRKKNENSEVKAVNNEDIETKNVEKRVYNNKIEMKNDNLIANNSAEALSINARINGNRNLFAEELKIQQEPDFEKQDKKEADLLRKQDKQIKIFEKAQKEIENGNLEEGISIIEDMTYNKGGIIVAGTSIPMYLAEVLYKNKMYERCWKYLNHISITHLDCLPKIKNLQSKICAKEKKYDDAFFFFVMSVVYTYQESCFNPSVDIIEMKMSKKMSKVKMIIQNEEMYQRILGYINNNLSEIEIRNDLRSLLI